MSAPFAKDREEAAVTIGIATGSGTGVVVVGGTVVADDGVPNDGAVVVPANVVCGGVAFGGGGVDSPSSKVQLLIHKLLLHKS